MSFQNLLPRVLLLCWRSPDRHSPHPLAREVEAAAPPEAACLQGPAPAPGAQSLLQGRCSKSSGAFCTAKPQAAPLSCSPSHYQELFWSDCISLLPHPQTKGKGPGSRGEEGEHPTPAHQQPAPASLQLGNVSSIWWGTSRGFCVDLEQAHASATLHSAQSPPLLGGSASGGSTRSTWGSRVLVSGSGCSVPQFLAWAEERQE